MITEKIKSYEDVCAVEGVDTVTSLPYPEPKDAEEIAINAFAKITRIVRVLNEGWQPDWNNGNELKYYPWFDMETYDEQVGSGVGFSYYHCDCDLSTSHVGARLVFKTRGLAEYAGETFLSIYREFMVFEK